MQSDMQNSHSVNTTRVTCQRLNQRRSFPFLVWRVLLQISTREKAEQRSAGSAGRRQQAVLVAGSPDFLKRVDFKAFLRLLYLVRLAPPIMTQYCA